MSSIFNNENIRTISDRNYILICTAFVHSPLKGSLLTRSHTKHTKSDVEILTAVSRNGLKGENPFLLARCAFTVQQKNTVMNYKSQEGKLHLDTGLY